MLPVEHTLYAHLCFLEHGEGLTASASKLLTLRAMEAAMEAFLSTPLGLDAVGKLIDGVPGGLPAMFGAVESQLASDCVRRAFAPELGMDVLEMDGVAELLPMALRHDSQPVREMLLRLLSGIATAQPARLRRIF